MRAKHCNNAYHGQEAGASVLPDEVFVCKAAAIDAQATGAVSLRGSHSKLSPVCRPSARNNAYHLFGTGGDRTFTKSPPCAQYTCVL